MVKKEVTNNAAGLQVTLKDDLDFSKNFSFQYSFFLKADGLNKSSTEKYLAEPQEFNFKLKSKYQTVRLGYSTVSWEGTDFINPMDIVNAKNQQDPLNPLTRGSAGVFYTLNTSHFSWDLIYIPKQTQTLLPGENSAWWPREFTLPTNTQDTTLLVPETLIYKVNDDEVLEKALDHNFAMRLKQQFDTWDISLGVYQGSSTTPALSPQISLTPIEIYPNQIYQINSPVVIQPIYYRSRVIAGSFSKIFESFIVRLSGQHAQPLTLDARVPGWSDLGVVAIEKNVQIFESDVTFLLQFVNSRRKDDGNLSLLSSLTEKSLMFGWRWPVTDELTWNAAFFQEQKKFSSFIHSDLTWSISDSWKQTFSVDVLSGSPESTLGTYDKNDRVGTTLSYLL